MQPRCTETSVTPQKKRQQRNALSSRRAIWPILGRQEDPSEENRRDQAAVLAALTYPWNQGQVEEQIHRLKLLERQSYGHAGFDLLRHQALARPA